MFPLALRPHIWGDRWKLHPRESGFTDLPDILTVGTATSGAAAEIRTLLVRLTRAALVLTSIDSKTLGPTLGIEPRSRPYQGRILPLNYEGLGPMLGLEPRSAHYGCAVLATELQRRWCGERDSNPCLSVGNAAYWPLYDPSTWVGRRESNSRLLVGSQGHQPLYHARTNWQGMQDLNPQVSGWSRAVCQLA